MLRSGRPGAQRLRDGMASSGRSLQVMHREIAPDVRQIFND